ncbi:MAG: hypothetical protein ABIU05_00535, partial [Nitrospirales bacterium]
MLGSLLDPALHVLARLAFSARIGRALSHRARSASKKGHLATPSHLSEAVRCASTDDHQAPLPPLFREQEDGQTCPWFSPFV